jgi:hypothetical protein
MVRFMDIRISILSGYYNGSIGLLTRLLMIESDRKTAS